MNSIAEFKAALDGIDAKIHDAESVVSDFIKERLEIRRQFIKYQLGLEPGVILRTNKGLAKVSRVDSDFCFDCRKDFRPWVYGHRKTASGWHKKEVCLYNDYQLPIIQAP